MDIIDQTLTRNAPKESAKVALMGLLCLYLSMAMHLNALFFGSLICISCRLFYRHYTWQRCLSGIGAVVLHMIAVLFIIYIFYDQFFMTVLGLGLYNFAVAFLSAMGKPDLETVFLCMFTPYLYVTVMTNPADFASDTAYWFAQMSIGFLAMLVLGAFSKPHPYRKALQQRTAELLGEIRKQVLSGDEAVLITNVVFDKYTKQISEIYSSNKDRQLYWMSSLLWIRSVAGFVIKFNRCYQLIRQEPKLASCHDLLQAIRDSFAELLVKTEAVIRGKASRIGFTVFDLRVSLLNLARNIDELRARPDWEQIPAVTRLATGELLSACQMTLKMFVEWVGFYQDNSEKVRGFTFKSAFLNTSLIAPAAIYAAKLAVAFWVGILLYRYFSPIIPSQFIATVLIISIEINLVSTFRKAAMRIAGSLIGLGFAIIGLTMYSHLSSLVWLLCYAYLILFISAYLCRPDAKYPYAGAMIAVMSFVVMFNSPDLATEINFIVNRSEGIFCGICVALFVTLLFWSFKPKKTVVKRFALILTEINKLSDELFYREDKVVVADRHRSQRLAIEMMLTKFRILMLDYKSLLSEQEFNCIESMTEVLERYYLVINTTLQAFQFMPESRRRQIHQVLEPMGVPLHAHFNKVAHDLYRGKRLLEDAKGAAEIEQQLMDKLNRGEYFRQINEQSMVQRADYAIIIGHQLIMAQLLAKLSEGGVTLKYWNILNEQIGQKPNAA